MYCFGNCSVNLKLLKSKKLDRGEEGSANRVRKGGRYGGSGPGDQEEEVTKIQMLHGQFRQMKHCLLTERQETLALCKIRKCYQSGK